MTVPVWLCTSPAPAVTLKHNHWVVPGTTSVAPWADMQTDCKPVFSTQSASSWKWHTTCPKSGYEADGEANFLDHENYTVKSSSVSKLGGTVRNSITTITAKWVSSDCGDVKPFDPKP